MTRTTLAALSLVLAACGGSEPPPAAPPVPAPAPAPPPTAEQPTPAQPKGYAAVERITFNRSATRLNLPLY